MKNSQKNKFDNTSQNLIEEGPNTAFGEEQKKTGLKKVTWIIIPLIILTFSFILGFVYFFNLDIIARYMIAKSGYALDIDELNLHLSGRFNIERLRYAFQNRQGVPDQIKMEYIGGSISPLGLIASDNLIMDINLRGVKIPFESGIISGGSWKIHTSITNIQKNVQQWDGDITINAEDAMIQYTVMNSNYVAIVKSGKIKGHIKNSILQLETSEILTDIAKITISGNTTMNYPYNLNIQLSMLPLDEFGKKYPDERNMLNTLLQKDPNIIINLNGTIDKIHPQIKNLNP